MNHDEPTTTDPELEARIVAWVLGEASAFETAELERLCAAQPALAIFKRRIEAVHGLVGKAARPDTQTLRLAPERREKLLQAIGGERSAETSPATATASTAASRRQPIRRSVTRGERVMRALISYGAAACVLFTIGMFLAESRFAPDRVADDDIAAAAGQITESSERAHRTPVENLRREEEKVRSRLAREVGGMAEAEPAKQIATITIPASRSALSGANTPASPPVSADAAPGWFGETVLEEPFEVTTNEYEGYTAATTLAGNRLNTELRDIGSSLSVVTSQFLQDTGATNSPSFLQYTSNTEAGAKDTSYFDGIANADFSLAASAGVAAAPPPAATSGPNRVLFGAGDPAGVTDKREPLSGYFNFRDLDTPEDSYKQESARSTNEPVRLRRTVGSESDLPVRGLVAAENSRLSGEEARMTVAEMEEQLQDLRKRREAAKPAEPSAAPRAKSYVAIAPEETSTLLEPFSTFSLHVSDASFKLAQAALARGEAPDPARIRPEEFYNAFDYGDPAPATADKIACRIEQAAHPVLQQRNLVRIAVRVPATGRGAGQPLRLTVLLDTSGSMERPDRVASVRRALEVLASLLGPADRVTLIGFARTPRLLAEALPGNEAEQLVALAAQTPAEGGTNLELALALALEKARQQFVATAQNRIVLLTDGAANLGDADPARLGTLVVNARQQGLAFDACGVGTAGLDDAILEALTRQGDGRYYVLDTPDDADAGFARQLAGAFRPAAQNVKLQVRFNPARVAHYRLIGFEKHRLRTEDFRNDKVDAAELAAEEAAVAVYQVAVRADGEGELGDVFVRFRDTATGTMVERSWTMPHEPRVRAFDQATATLQLAGVAALLAEKLRGGAMADLVQLGDLAPVVNRLRGHYVNDTRVQEFVAMFEQARRMAER